MAALLACTGLGVMLGVSQSTSTPQPSIDALVNAFNVQYDGDLQPPVHIERVLSTGVPPSAAVKRLDEYCNDRGATVVRAALVKTTLSPHELWAVFVDPTGNHIAVSAEPVTPPAVANWYLGFVDAFNGKVMFCSFGVSPSLPPLPVHGGAAAS